MIEVSIRLRQGKFFVGRSERGGNYDVNRMEFPDTFNLHEGKLVFFYDF
jgi:hypothetical protein